MAFDSEHIIKQGISEPGFRAYSVGFDFQRYRDEELSEKLMDTIVDFAFGYHTGILKTYNRQKLKEAARAIYKIDSYKAVRKVYLEDDSELFDCEITPEQKYLKRGEFGEMILHLILRDFFSSTPLVSKIHFKDTDGGVVHGFDVVHIGQDLNDPNKNTLYLGESKVYSRKDNKAGERGIEDLIGDIKAHFKTDFFLREIALIGKKRDAYISLSDYRDANTKQEYEGFLQQKEYWFDAFAKVESGQKKLQDLFSSISIPLICTYQSTIFDGITDESSQAFIDGFEKETAALRVAFDTALAKIVDEVGQPPSANLNIILILFPIPSKKQLITKLHNKLNAQQNA